MVGGPIAHSGRNQAGLAIDQEIEDDESRPPGVNGLKRDRGRLRHHHDNRRGCDHNGRGQKGPAALHAQGHIAVAIAQVERQLEVHEGLALAAATKEIVPQLQRDCQESAAVGIVAADHHLHCGILRKRGTGKPAEVFYQ